MDRLRIIQWATGSVGRHAAAAVMAHPELELVGAYVYSENKVGLDVGEICGIADTGVRATNSVADIIALADGLGATIDDFTFDRQVAVTDEPFEVKAGPVAAGTVSAQRFSCSAIVDGRPALTVEHITRLRGDAGHSDIPGSAHDRRAVRIVQLKEVICRGDFA